MKYLLHRILLLTFGLLQIATASAQKTIFKYTNPQPLHEVRAVWLTTLNGLDWPSTKATDARSIEKQKEELRDILDNLQYVHINTVIIQARIRGSVIYSSAYEPWDECITGKRGGKPDYDPLEFCIEECHARGMECHAWMVAIPLGKAARQSSYGEASVSQKHPELCRTVGEEMFMLPGKKETADYIANMCREVAEKYDVDGISLDYIRYPESTYKFSDDDLCDEGSSKNKAEWRRENITRIVRAVHDKVKAVKPWVKLSSSPVGKYRSLKRFNASGWNCRDGVYQDPVAWLNEGIQDMVFPMMYFKENNFYPFLMDWAETTKGRIVCPGLGIYFLDPRHGNWNINDIRAEVFTTRNREMGGVGFFRSDFLTRNCGGLFDCCYEELFLYPSLQPRMTWERDTIAPSKPEKLRFTAGRMEWEKSVDFCPSKVIMPSSPHNYVTYNVYGSSRYPVDTKNAENLLFARTMSSSFNIENISSSKKYFAVTAVDRFGNESEPVQGQYDGGDLTRNIDVRSLINNTYQTAIPVMPEINVDDIVLNDESHDFNMNFDMSGLDMENAIISKQSREERDRSRERIVLVPINRNKQQNVEPKKLSITARNNLRKKLKRERKEREEREKALNLGVFE